MTANTNQAPIEVEIGITLNKLAQQLARAEARMAKTAKKMEGDFAKGFGDANKGAQAFAGNGLRQVSMQLSQVAQQGSATGNYLQALAIQLPDIGLAFGTIGIAAGVAAGALLPVVSNLIGVADEGKKADDAAKAFNSTISQIKGVIDIASASLDELTQKYGENAGAAREAAIILAQIAAAGAERAATEAIATSQAQLKGIEDQINAAKRLEMAWRAAIEQEAQGVATAEQVLVAYEAYQATVEEIESQTGRTLQQNLQLSDALAKMRAEMERGTISAEFREAAEAALAVANASGTVDEELQKALESAIKLELTEAELAKLSSIVAGEVSGIASAMSAAADEAGRFSDNLAAAALAEATNGGPDAARAAVMSGEAQREFFENNALKDSITPPKKTASRRSGGGAGGGSGGLSEEMQAAKRLFDETRTSAENYAAEIAEIEALHAGGFIDADTYARGIEMVGEKYRDAIGEGEAFADLTNMLQDAILDFAENGVSAMDDLADAIKRAALQAALFGEGPLAGVFSKFFGGSEGGLIGGVMSGLKLPSRDGGGFTWNGPRSGGLDGRGGQLALLHPNETVIDHSRGQSMGGSIVYSPTIDARGASEEAVARLARVMAEDRRAFADNVRKVMKTPMLAGRG